MSGVPFNVQAKPQAKKWRRTAIKNYDILKELFGDDRATGKKATTALDRLNQWERETIDLNEDDGTREADANMFDGQQSLSHNFDEFSPQIGPSNQSTGTSSSRGTKRKRNMIDLMEAQLEKMDLQIMGLTEAMKDGNSISDKLHHVAERQVEVAEKQAEIAEKHLAFIQQTRPRHYSESEVWNMIEELNVPDEYRMACYDHLCDNEQKKRKIFGVPPHMRVQALIQIMKDVDLTK